MLRMFLVSIECFLSVSICQTVFVSKESPIYYTLCARPIASPIFLKRRRGRDPVLSQGRRPPYPRTAPAIPHKPVGDGVPDVPLYVPHPGTRPRRGASRSARRHAPLSVRNSEDNI